MEITTDGVKVIELVAQVTPEHLQEVTGVTLDFSALGAPASTALSHRSAATHAPAELQK
jgi:acyl CoA:acetate/3-ketoacid CoA transferase beta subunit